MHSPWESRPITAVPLPPNQVWNSWTDCGTLSDSLPYSPEPLEIAKVGEMCMCFLISFKAQGAPGWTRATCVCSLWSVCLLSHGWGAVKSKCVSVIFLIRWEFISLPSNGHCGCFSAHLWIVSELLWNKPNIFSHHSIFHAVLDCWSFIVMGQ